MRVSNSPLNGLLARFDGALRGWLPSRTGAGEDADTAGALMRGCVIATLGAILVLPPLFLMTFTLPVALAAGLGAAALPLVVAAVAGTTQSAAAAHATALVLSSAALTLLAATTGGLSSPYLIWFAAIPAEAAALGRTRRAGLWGALAAAFGIAAVALAAKGENLALGLPVLALLAALAGLAAHALARVTMARHAAVGAQSAEAPSGLAAWDGDDRSRTYDLFPGLVTVHDLSGNVLSVHGADKAACVAWLTDAAGRGFMRQIHVSDRIAFLQALDAIRLGERRRTLEVRLQRPRGPETGEQFVHLNMELCAIRNAIGGVKAILAQSRDISAEVKLRADAMEKAGAAESANAAKTRFLAAVSHELRTPLNAILGFSDVLAHGYFGTFNDERQREYVNLIRQSGAHLLSLVNTMLDMSKIEAGRYDLLPEPFDIAEAIAVSEQMLALQAREKGLTLTSRIARGTGPLVADRRAVTQILINLVANAVKFTEAGGVVTIDAETVGDRLRLVVADTGIGIAPDRIAEVGEPFMQVDTGLARRYEGTGLGLSLVKGLVGLHGGTFAIESRLGEGTVVTVTLPREGAPASGSALEDAHGAVSQRAAAPASARPIVFPPNLARRGAAAGTEDGKERHDAQARTA